MSHRIRSFLARSGAFLAVVLAVGGCAVAPSIEDDPSAPVRFRTVAGAPDVRDERPAFRTVFCSMLRTEGVVPADDHLCDRWLWRLRDEPAAVSGRSIPALDPRQLDLVLVTGAFSECAGDSSRPFSVGAARLRAAGAKVRTIVVGGRSGTAHNARQIKEAIAASPADEHRKVILVGYSKGGLDVLRFLVDFPDLATRVNAVVAVATPVFGSPLAELAAPAYAALAAKLPRDECPPGDGEVLASLTPAAATTWLEANPLPPGVRHYSLVAFTTRQHVSHALTPAWQHLGAARVRNDGQVMATDAVIPGSTLLGFANADHWGIAQSIEKDHPVLAGRPDPEPFPLEQLFVSVVTFVAHDLAQTSSDAPEAASAGSGTLPE